MKKGFVTEGYACSIALAHELGPGTEAPGHMCKVFSSEEGIRAHTCGRPESGCGIMKVKLEVTEIVREEDFQRELKAKGKVEDSE